MIFDMYETLITQYQSPIYFSAQMAADAGIPEARFRSVWHASGEDRTLGKISMEETLEMILRKNHCYSEKLLAEIVQKRLVAKRECFRHLHPEIIPLLSELKKRKVLMGLISNCFSEEVAVVRESELFPYFDAVYLSYEQKIQKPDPEIFERCRMDLAVKPEECLYVGDGGSNELEAARELGMTAVQAEWYLKEGSGQLSKPKPDFPHFESPLEVLDYFGGCHE